MRLEKIRRTQEALQKLVDLSGPTIKPGLILTKVVGQISTSFLCDYCAPKKAYFAARKPD